MVTFRDLTKLYWFYGSMISVLSCGVSTSPQLHAACSLELREVPRMVPTELDLN